MKRISLLLSVVVVCFIAAVQAQAPTPKPDPAFKQLSHTLGRWTYVCDYKAGPLGPASKVNGEFNSQMILSGFVLKGQWTEKGPSGEVQGLEIYRYDPENKNFIFTGWMNDGSTYSGTLTVKENTETNAGKFVIGGKEYMEKATVTYASDWMSAMWKAEISADGKTWVPWFEQNMTKVKPAAKK